MKESEKLRVLRVDRNHDVAEVCFSDFGVVVDRPMPGDAGSSHVWTRLREETGELSVGVRAGNNRVRIVVFRDGTMLVKAGRKTGRNRYRRYGDLYLWQSSQEESEAEQARRFQEMTKGEGIDRWSELTFPDRPGLRTVAIDLGIRCPAFITVMENGNLLEEMRIDQHDLRLSSNRQMIERLLGRLEKGKLEKFIRENATDISKKLSAKIVGFVAAHISETEEVVVILEDLTWNNATMPNSHDIQRRLLASADRDLELAVIDRIWSLSFRKTIERTRADLIIMGVRTHLVNPDGTSRVCSQCGRSCGRNRYRAFRCKSCGFEANRDLNASMNMHKLYWADHMSEF